MKKKWGKRWLCLALSFLMVVTSLPSRAYADDISDNDIDTSIVEEISGNDETDSQYLESISENDVEEDEDTSEEENYYDADYWITERDDGVWLWPLASDSSRNAVSDWAGCRADCVCPFNCGIAANHAGCTPYHNDVLGHNGMDIGVYDTVRAAAAGTVVCIGEDGGRGNTIVIQHDAGNDEYYYSYYQHLSVISVSKNQNVSVGQAIGVSGNTGVSVGGDGTHLHFGMVYTKGYKGVTDFGSLYTVENNYGWATKNSDTRGRIVVNPRNAGFTNNLGNNTLYGHRGSITYTTDPSQVRIGSKPKGVLDVNGFLDNYQEGLEGNSLGSIATFDVYIGGKLKGNDVNDYCAEEEVGATYEIKDIKPKAGASYVRTLSGSLSGKITKERTDVYLYFSSKKISLDYQGGKLSQKEYHVNGPKVKTLGKAPSGAKNVTTKTESVYRMYHYHNEYENTREMLDSVSVPKNWDFCETFMFVEKGTPDPGFADHGNNLAYTWDNCGKSNYGYFWFRDKKDKTVTYYNWDNVITIENSVNVEKNNLVLLLPTPVKDGFVFMGYNTKKDGTGTTYKAGNNVTVADGVETLYAIWETPAATKIDVTAPAKTTYFVGEELDLTGGTVKVTYNYSDPKTVSLTSSMISGYDKTKVGKQTVTVTYEGFTGTFEVTVKTPSITEIALTAPAKSEYFLGEELDLTGGKVTATYDYGEPVTVDLTADMVSGYTRTKLGEQTITVTYEGFTKTFVVTVKAISITKIEVTAPAKTMYLVGENLNLEGGKITVYYDYGNPAEVKLSEGTIIDFDNTKTGKQTLTVIYKEFTATFEVTVASSKMTGIKVTAPTKVEYYVGEDLDLTGGKITVSYDKADSEVVELSESMISGYDKNKVGKQTITVTYDKFTATFAVTVKALPGTYTITYQNCTGAENPNPATYKEGEGLVLLDASKPGARFGYWYIKNGSKEEQITEIPADAKKNYVIYAKWIPYVYKFSFDNNVSSITDYYGGEKTPGVSGTMSPQTINGGSGTMLRNVAYAITGYEFVGWTTEADGSGEEYENRQKITYIEGNPETITLYAQWKKISYEIDYVGLSDEEVFAYSLPSEYQIDTETIVFADYKDSVVKEGYNFKGFYKNKKYSTTFKDIPIGSTGNKTVYMKFTANKYKVSYKRNESSIMDFSGTNLKKSGSMSTQTITYGRETALSKNAFKVTGYRFTGWSLNADGSGDTFADKEKVLNLTPENGEVVVLYAQWEKVVYSISYVGLKEGEVDTFGLPTTYVVDSETIKFSDYSGSMFREGYTFKNWYKDKKYQNTMKSIASGSTGNKTVYVKFAANKYKIAFKRNESSIDVPAGTRLRCSGSMSKQTITYDRNTALTKNAFKINGYKFVGWDTEPDGTGIRYTDKEKVLNLTSESGETITLYAQWEKK